MLPVFKGRVVSFARNEAYMLHPHCFVVGLRHSLSGSSFGQLLGCTVAFSGRNIHRVREAVSYTNSATCMETQQQIFRLYLFFALAAGRASDMTPYKQLRLRRRFACFDTAGMRGRVHVPVLAPPRSHAYVLWILLYL